jgi:hypothetical protein
MALTRGTFTLSALAFCLGAAGCEGCLNLDDYQLVDADFPIGGGGSGASISTGGGGEGGTGPGCDVVAGFMLVTLSVDASGAIGPCDDSVQPGARLYALSPEDGSCLAHAAIRAEPGAQVRVPLAVRHRLDNVAYVVGGYDGGSAALPDDCNGTGEVLLPPVVTGTGLFVARLERQNFGYCTQWSRVATAPAAPFEAMTYEVDAAGSIAVGGRLGGQTASFDSGAGLVDVTAGAFFAHYRVDGTLDDLVAFDGDGDDTILGMKSVAGDWLVAGTLRREDPVCHGCTGTTQVVAAAADCGGVGGAGGGGGQGGAGGQGGGQGGGMAASDANNALLWRWTGPTLACSDVDTFGSDADPADAQAMFDVDTRINSGGCVTYVTGLAGRAAWRLGADPVTTLFDAGGATSDGFVASRVSTAGSCGAGELSWSARLSADSGVTWGNQVRASRCGAGAKLSAHVAGSAAGAITMHRCDAAGTCTSDDPLDVGSGNRVAIVGLDQDGSASWHASFGPSVAGATSLGAAPSGELVHDLAVDNRDHLAIVVETSDALVESSLDVEACLGFSLNTPAGRYAIGLEPTGNSAGEGVCTWFIGLP